MRTCTVLNFTDGRTTVYSVLRGKMRGRYFDSRTAVEVGRFKFLPGEPVLTYRAMTAAHATKESPAVYWQTP